MNGAGVTRTVLGVWILLMERSSVLMNVMRAVEICALTARSAGVRRILSFVPRISIFMGSNESMIDYAIIKK